MTPRVLMTADVVGGVWDFALLLAEEFGRRSAADVTLLALGEPSREQRVAADAADIDLRTTRVKLEWMRDAADDVARTRDVVAELAQTTGASVIHANHFAAACAPTDIPVVLTLHSDVLSWWWWTLGSPADPNEWHDYIRLAHAALQRAAAVVGVSQFLAREVVRLYQVSRPVDVIHNGWPAVDLDVVQPARAFTLVAGRLWDAAKNIDVVRRAAEGWECGPVFLAGDARHPESGGVLEIGEPLHLLGLLPPARLAIWLRQAAVYVSAARYDPFGLLPLQAALADCALLLSDMPSYRELWDGAACFFQPNDADDLRDKWSWLMSDAARQHDLARRARERATACYSSSRMADAYLELYSRVCETVAV